MLIVHVFIHVREGCEAAFEKATLENARNSVQEPGIARFDLLRQQGEPRRYMLVEAYRSADAPARHKETAHYAAWREAVEPMMAEPRQSVKFENIWPGDEGWG